MSRKMFAIGVITALLSGTGFAADRPETMPWDPNNFAGLPPEQLPAAIAATKAKVAQDQIEENQLKARIRALTGGRLDISTDTLQKAAEKLDDQIDDAKLQVDALGARKTAIADEMEAVMKKGQDAVDKDPVVVELLKVVDVRQKEVDRDVQMVAAATMSRSDLDQASAALADAKAQVELQREHAAAGAGGDAMVGLQKELIDVTIDEAEQSVRLDELEKRRAHLEQAIDLANTLDQVRGDEAQSLGDIENGTNALAQARKENSQTQP
jgi:hypothetical protein